MPKEKRRHESEKHRSRSRRSSGERHQSSSKSKKKTYTRQRSRSRSASKSSNNSVELLKTLEERRIHEQLERKRLKEDLKAQETPEEKRARRLLEKQAKEHRRRQRMGWDIEYQLYSNEDNPFGDSNLTSSFTWNKKLEKEGLQNVSAKAVEVISLQKQLENKRELEKVKKRRMERELERQARDDEMMLAQRAKEVEQFREWQRQEDQFHLEQARLRSEIRIRDGRAKPIDLLAQYVSGAKLEDAIEMQMNEPYVLLNGLDIGDLEDLLIDIKVYVELENGKNNDFWNDMIVIVEDELQKQQKHAENEKSASAAAEGGRRDGIHQSVVKDVADIFRGKNASQLDELRIRIETKINGRSDGVDISYWESLLSQLKAHMARARLRDRHQFLLRQKLHMLKTECDETTTLPEQTDETATTSTAVIKDESRAVEDADDDDAESNTDSENLIEAAIKLYVDGGYSPQYIRESDLDDGIHIVDQSDDERHVTQLRLNCMQKERESNALTQQEIQMRNEARKGMLGDEAEFSVETTVEAPLQMSTDKYRPRKPRYFNRVHTGFEWNKYNQTHYDMDNPPPKIVQGYKFNIFYPDLIDKSMTPQYFLTPCEDNADFAVLRFHTGPPYEDIAFKIVNREWEFSYKRGFRCQFHNNIFQLWFHFKRYRYRR